MLHLGCVTYNLLKDWDLETIIRNLEAAGYEAVELRTGHKHGIEPSLNEAQRNQVRERFQKSKVRLLSFGSTCEFESPDAAVRQQQVEIGKQWVSLAHDTGAWGVKVRPNGLPKGVPIETTIDNIAASLRELGDYGLRYGVEIWMEVHGHTTQNPPVAGAIMRAAKHQNVGVCWNSNPTDVVNGSVKASFELLKPWIRNVHINDLSNSYPWRELFTLLRDSGYERYTLAEVDPESKEPERFLRYYRALWTELSRA
ncbi:MAG TPA: sugar phosphate isomerase/epimerase family protein [Bryobacteraceae bacterium]|jgi:sugar phosphate isomerase/epimerase|nr:sugar phosphate isomerase/epimerase family protein [Bryobacteraceae bacterium]